MNLPADANGAGVPSDIDLLELATIGMVVTDPSGCFLRVNSAFADLLGRSPVELIGVSLSAVTWSDDIARSEAVRRELLDGRIETARFEKRYIRPDGAPVWVDVNIRSLKGPDGQVTAFLTQTVDITRRKAADAELAEVTAEAQRLAMVARATANAVVITGPDGRIQWVNRAFTRMSGYRLEEVVGRTRVELVQGSGANSVEVVDFFARLARNEPANGELWLTARNGRRYCAHLQVRPVVEDGAIVQMVQVEQDVTARRQAEDLLVASTARAQTLTQALSRQEELLAAMMGAVPEMVFWKDAQRRYIGCNTAYLTFRGYQSPTELEGRDERMLDPDGQVAGVLDEVELAVLASGQAILDRRVCLPDRDGTARVVRLSVLPLGGPEGAHGLVGVGTDIT